MNSYKNSETRFPFPNNGTKCLKKDLHNYRMTIVSNPLGSFKIFESHPTVTDNSNTPIVPLSSCSIILYNSISIIMGYEKWRKARGYASLSLCLNVSVNAFSETGEQ